MSNTQNNTRSTLDLSSVPVRNKTKEICLHHKNKKLFLGADNPIRVQSMTNTKTHDTDATCAQIRELAEADCEIVRLAVPDKKAGDALRQINDFSPVPLIADIHFDHRLAIQALEAGLSGLRINPGNIGDDKHIAKLADCAKAHNAVIRVGVNSGSIEKNAAQKYTKVVALVESALYHVKLLEQKNFFDIKISLKSSSVNETVQAYSAIRNLTSYPLHIGVTEAGTLYKGTVNSCVGIGTLLALGIGDTLRVSLTADPKEEVKVGYDILKALGLRKKGAQIISCPTCGRTQIDLISLAQKIEELYKDCPLPLKIAVMGCVVNGPGEAKEADIGIAAGKNKGIIFKKGKVIRSLPEDSLLDAFITEINELIDSYGNTDEIKPQKDNISK